jgi:hypothetical protein
MSAYIPCVFIKDNTGLILKVHVDDINVMGKELQLWIRFFGAEYFIFGAECRYIGVLVGCN